MHRTTQMKKIHLFIVLIFLDVIDWRSCEFGKNANLNIKFSYPSNK